MKKYHSRKFRRRLRKIKFILSIICVGILVLGNAYIIRTGVQQLRERELAEKYRSIYYQGMNVAEAQTIENGSEGDGAEGQTIENESEGIGSEARTLENGSEGGGAELQTAESGSEASRVTDAPLTDEENKYETKTSGPASVNDGAEAENAVQPEKPVLQPAFVELYAENQDVIGWIKLGDIIDYPILWRDNTYYMNRGFDGKDSIAGAIFLDERNQPDMSDSAMLIYGHNMRNGSMFGELDRYRERDFLRANPMFTIQSAWEAEERKYVLLSVFDASMNRSDSSYIKIIRTSFEKPEDKEEFISEMCARSLFDIDIEASSEDQLVTLVTCSYFNNNGRLLIFARELREDETEADMMAQFQNMRLK